MSARILSQLTAPAVTLNGNIADDRAGTAGSAVGDQDAQINILIVDDEPGNLLVLETVLDDPGYRLVRALSADHALLALVEEEFALLILDVRMPGMTGFELAQMVKERKKTAGVPIIFLTAYYDKDQHILQGYGTGAVDYLNKPVNPAVLRSKVSVFADLHRKNRAITLSNRALVAEIEERRRVAEQLRELNDSLELRVIERTEALRQADHKLRDMMNSITDGLMMLNRDWRCTYVNAQGAKLLGVSPDHLLGGRVWELLPQTVGTRFEEAFFRAINVQQTVSFEAFFPDPLNVWLECHCYPSDEGLSVYFHDIDDRHEMETRREQLLAAEQAARTEGERVARAKDEFLASLSHELRTPIAGIVGWAKLLQRHETDAETLRRGLDAIARNAEVQSQLIADLLDMSRFVSGKLRVNLSRMDLNAIALAAADNVRPAALIKGVEIAVTLADGPALEIAGDPARLQQIASNLVTNALKFTPAGGSVTIATARSEAAAMLSVTDTGQGITAEFLPHLFDRFSQADGSATRVHGGLGLGLSIVKNLVELHCGNVTASSLGKGHGASFCVSFPHAQSDTVDTQLSVESSTNASGGADISADDAQAEDSQVDLQNIKVLVVEDNADMLEVALRTLRDCGATVTATASGDEALQRLQANHFDVLLSDLGMPGMDGYQLIHNVRSVLGLSAAALPAAAVTAFVRPEDQQRAISAGFQICLQKPVYPMTLARTVQALLHGRFASDSAVCLAGSQRSRDNVGEQSIAERKDSGPQVSNAADTRLRALFVEDNLDLQELIGCMIQEEGLDVVTCGSAEEGLLELNKGHFDVIMTDISLPKMKGVEFARRILAESPQTWVIFSTGYPVGDTLSSIGANVRALIKPFEAEELHRVMEEVRADLRRT